MAIIPSSDPHIKRLSNQLLILLRSHGNFLNFSHPALSLLKLLSHFHFIESYLPLRPIHPPTIHPSIHPSLTTSHHSSRQHEFATKKVIPSRAFAQPEACLRRRTKSLGRTQEDRVAHPGDQGRTRQRRTTETACHFRRPQGCGSC